MGPILTALEPTQRLSSINTRVGVSVAGSVVPFANAVKLLGVTLYSTLTFDQHTTNLVRVYARTTCEHYVTSDHFTADDAI